MFFFFLSLSGLDDIRPALVTGIKPAALDALLVLRLECAHKRVESELLFFFPPAGIKSELEEPQEEIEVALRPPEARQLPSPRRDAFESPGLRGCRVKSLLRLTVR